MQTRRRFPARLHKIHKKGRRRRRGWDRDMTDPSELRAAIGELYRQVDAPAWAAPNLDGLADVLRDLSWLPDGAVHLRVPAVRHRDQQRLHRVLAQAVTESADSPHPVHLRR